MKNSLLWKTLSLLLGLALLFALMPQDASLTPSALADTTVVTFADEDVEDVIRLNLSKAQGDPITVSDMESITTLNLSYALFVDTLQDLRYCKNLRVLYARELGISDISPLAGLTNLSELYLNWNQISDLSPLSGLTNLTVLDVDTNQINDISALSGLKNLTQLYLYSNQIRDLRPLAGLTNLTYLDLDINQVADVSALAGLTKLTELGLNDNQIADIGPLSRLVNLENLYLSENQISSISALSGLSKLTVLEMSYNRVSDYSALSGLTNLTNLYSVNNQASDISPLSSLVNLEYLYLSGNQISDIRPLSRMTKLTDLDLVDNQLSDVSPLAGLTRLEYLYASDNLLSDISALSGLTNLYELYLDYNQISDIRPLSGMKNLEYLYLEQNLISDVSPLSALAGSLFGELDLRNNPIADPTPIQGIIDNGCNVSLSEYVPETFELLALVVDLTGNTVTLSADMTGSMQFAVYTVIDSNGTEVFRTVTADPFATWENAAPGMYMATMVAYDGDWHSAETDWFLINPPLKITGVYPMEWEDLTTASTLSYDVELEGAPQFLHYTLYDKYGNTPIVGDTNDFTIYITPPYASDFMISVVGYDGTVWSGADSGWVHVEEEKAVLKGLGASASSLILGDSVRFAIDMTGPFNFARYMVYNQYGAQVANQVLTEKQFAFTPSEAGDYFCEVVVYDGANWLSAKTDWLRVESNVTEVKGLASKKSAYTLGDTMSFAIDMTGRFDFAKYTVYNQSGAEVAGVVSYEKGYSFTPATVGEYFCVVVVYDGVNWHSAKTGWVSVRADETKVNALRANKGGYSLGETMTFSIDMTGTLNFAKFTVYNHYGVEVASDIAYGKTYSFAPTYADDYYCDVLVYDGANWLSAKTGWIQVR